MLDRSWLRDAEVVARGAAETPRRSPRPGRLPLRTIDVAALWQRYVDAGIGVAALGSPAYPAPLADDIEPPAIAVPPRRPRP